MTASDRTLGRVRRLCLALPETTERASWGHPNFRTPRRTFVTFEAVKSRPSIAFRLNAADVDLLLRRRSFFVTPYGRGQWVSVWADRAVDWRLVTRLVRNAHRLAMKR